MIKEVTFDLFKKYAKLLKEYYKNNDEIKKALLNIGLDSKNMINLNNCFKIINPCFSIEFLNQNKNFDVLFDEIENKNINIDKTKFINIMSEFESFTKKIDDSSYKIRKLTDNEWDVYFPTGEFILNDFLNDIFDDEEMDCIGYFIYELEFGSKWHEGMVLDKKGNDIPLKDASDLYDLLLSK